MREALNTNPSPNQTLSLGLPVPLTTPITTEYRATVEQLHDLAARADYEPPAETALTFERVRWGTA